MVVVMDTSKRKENAPEEHEQPKQSSYHQPVYAECGERIPPWVACSVRRIYGNPQAMAALRMLAAGATLAQVAQARGISKRTISKYKAHPDGRRHLLKLAAEMDHVVLVGTFLENMDQLKKARRKRR